MSMRPYEPPWRPILLPIIVEMERSMARMRNELEQEKKSDPYDQLGWMSPFHYRPDWFSARSIGGTPLKVDRSDPNNFSCGFDLDGFESGDIKVKTIGHKVIVDAVRENEHADEEHQSFSRLQFHRSLVLPENVNAEQLASTFDRKTGVLKLKAPYLALPPAEEHHVPIIVEKMEEVEGN